MGKELVACLACSQMQSVRTRDVPSVLDIDGK